MIHGRARGRALVRIPCSEVLGVEVLPAMLAGFHHDHPRVQVELAATNRSEDPARGPRCVRRGAADLAAPRPQDAPNFAVTRSPFEIWHSPEPPPWIPASRSTSVKRQRISSPRSPFNRATTLPV